MPFTIRLILTVAIVGTFTQLSAQLSPADVQFFAVNEFEADKGGAFDIMSARPR